MPARAKLFHLLFMSEQSEPTDIEHTLMLIDANYEEILNSVKEPYGLQEEDAKRLYQHLWIYTHGIFCYLPELWMEYLPEVL